MQKVQEVRIAEPVQLQPMQPWVPGHAPPVQLVNMEMQRVNRRVINALSAIPNIVRLARHSVGHVAIVIEEPHRRRIRRLVSVVSRKFDIPEKSNGRTGLAKEGVVRPAPRLCTIMVRWLHIKTVSGIVVIPVVRRAV